MVCRVILTTIARTTHTTNLIITTSAAKGPLVDSDLGQSIDALLGLALAVDHAGGFLIKLPIATAGSGVTCFQTRTLSAESVEERKVTGERVVGCGHPATVVSVVILLSRNVTTAREG